MKVHAHLTRSDIARANLLVMRRSPSSLRSVLLLALAVGLFAAVDGARPHGLQAWLLLAGLSLAGGILVYLLMAAFSLAWILLHATEQAGATGDHVFEISDEGFRERTPYNDSLHAWCGLQKPLRSSDLILVRINAFLVHVIPRRIFARDEDFEAWWTEIDRRSGRPTDPAREARPVLRG